MHDSVSWQVFLFSLPTLMCRVLTLFIHTDMNGGQQLVRNNNVNKKTTTFSFFL